MLEEHIDLNYRLHLDELYTAVDASTFVRVQAVRTLGTRSNNREHGLPVKVDKVNLRLPEY